MPEGKKILIKQSNEITEACPQALAQGRPKQRIGD